MNEALFEIASRYDVAEDRISEILTGMKLKNPEKPTKRQLEGFEKVCTLLKEGRVAATQKLTISCYNFSYF